MRRTILTQPGAYGFAVTSVAVCSVVRWLLSPLLENRGLYLAFMIPVALSAYAGGAGPGVVSAVLSAAIASPVLFQFHGLHERANIAHLLLFAIESAAVILLMRKLQQARDEARQALDAADAARRLAEEANRAKEEFVARVSHEWRAPVNTISGWLWQLERRGADHDFVIRAGASMRRAVDTQSRLVSDLLDYSRGSRGKLSIHPERLAICEPIRRATDAMSTDAANKRLTVTAAGGHGDARVWGDAVRLEQVFTNLLQNAIKFTPCGGTILIGYARSDDQIEVTVTDSGIEAADPDVRVSRCYRENTLILETRVETTAGDVTRSLIRLKALACTPSNRVMRKRFSTAVPIASWCFSAP